MITRYAIFNGTVKAGMESEMRMHVEAVLAPLWRKFACAEKAEIFYGVEQDKNGPVIPVMLAITYADEEAMAKGLNSPARYESRDLLPAFYEKYFDEVTLWHYVMETDTATS